MKLKDLCSCPDEVMVSFGKWLYISLCNIIDNASKRLVKVSTFKERVWREYHTLRSSTDFKHRWIQLLTSHKMDINPLFYQKLSLEVFSRLLKEKKRLPVVNPDPEEVAGMTYEEENAVRYIGGYLLRKLSTEHLNFSEELKELENADDDLEPAESEEWMCSIDRGGLIRITDKMYQTQLAIEYVTRMFFSESSVTKMDDTFRVVVTDAIMSTSEVQFHWSLASSQMDTDCAETILELIELTPMHNCVYRI